MFEPVKPGPEPDFQLENAKTSRRYHFRFRTLSQPMPSLLISIRVLLTLKHSCRINNWHTVTPSLCCTEVELFLQHKRKRARVIPYLMSATGATKGTSHLRQCLGHLQSGSDGLSVGRDTPIVLLLLSLPETRFTCKPIPAVRCQEVVTGDEPGNVFLKPTEDDILGAYSKCFLAWAQSQNRHLLIDAARGLKMDLGQRTIHH